MARRKTDAGEIKFEQALSELETIIKLMEEGNLDLDTSLEKFEKGIQLVRICEKKLAQAERNIDVLLCSENGELIFKPAKITEDRNG